MKRFEITELPPYLILYIKVSIIYAINIYFGLSNNFFIDFRDSQKIHFLLRKIQQL